ncbi:MAG: peptidyl-prolyl cis-trans isomerase [Candidatus Aminicenantes bacterium]|jgi:hypothetical protein
MQRSSTTCWGLFFPCVLLCLFTGCDSRPVPEEPPDFNLSDPEKKIRIILRIEDSFYFNSDFEKHLKLLVGDEYKNLDLISLSRLMDNFIEDKLLLKAARKSSITPGWDEQKQYLARMSNSSWPSERENSPSVFEAQTLLQRQQIEKYILLAVSNIEVGEKEINSYYEQHKRDFLRPERVAVSQILLDTEEKAVKIFENVQGCPREYFQQVAKEVSLGVEAAKGGEMGVFEMNQLPFEMEKVIFSLKVGEISQVVESAYGFHIFRLDAKLKPELESLEEVAAEIRVKILDHKIKKSVAQHLAELKNTMDWEFYPKNLSFPYQRNTNE